MIVAWSDYVVGTLRVLIPGPGHRPPECFLCLGWLWNLMVLRLGPADSCRHALSWFCGSPIGVLAWLQFPGPGKPVLKFLVLAAISLAAICWSWLRFP